MGFMDKAKQMAEQVQKEAKDGTLKERAKALADQAQQKLDEVQGQINSAAGQAPSEAGSTVEYDEHGRSVPTESPQASDVEPAAPESQPTPSAPKAPPSGNGGMTSGDPLAG